ncbi:MAG: hypothetical protein JWN72_191 [Thermoleophilia bacterium]|nr:hypothetical protein [Thermoleophilia bacterium]
MSDSAPDAFFDAMHAFGPPSDPFADPTLLQHPGVIHLRGARDMVRASIPNSALDVLAEAHHAGVPAELMPHARVLEAAALVLAGRPADAIAVATDAWRDYPDVAALPAVLGSAHLAAGDTASAAHTMHAALISEDPDRSLALHRAVLVQLFTVLVRGRGADPA